MTKIFLKKILRNSTLNNFFFISIYQITNLLFPIIIIPYLSKKIGIERFGIVSLTQSVMTVFVMITDYGFSYTAVRELSIFRDDNTKIIDIFNGVIQTKLTLAIICLVFLLIAIVIIPKFHSEWILLITSYSIVIASVFTPLWFFQGLESIRLASFINILPRLFFVLLIFVFVNQKVDYLWVNILLGTGGILGGILSIIYIRIHFNIRLHTRFNIITVKKYLIDGWKVFLSIFLIAFFSNINIFILSFFSSNEIVGVYSITEKITNIIRQVSSVYSQAIYPHICYTVEYGSKIELKKFFKKLSLVFTPFILAICILVFCFAEIVAAFFTSESSDMLVYYLRIACFVPFINFLSIPFYRTLLANKLNDIIFKDLLRATLICMITNIIFAYYFSGIGTIFAVLLTEISILYSFYVSVKRQKVL